MMNKCERDVTWTEVATMEQARSCHVCFKMGEYVFVAGGVCGTNRLTSCERYDVKKNTWEKLPWYLPYPVKHASAVVSSEERYCFITGGLISPNLRVSMKWKTYNGMIVFNNEEGFEDYHNVFRIKREKHVSMII
jgi:hypothetical protein